MSGRALNIVLRSQPRADSSERSGNPGGQTDGSGRSPGCASDPQSSSSPLSVHVGCRYNYTRPKPNASVRSILQLLRYYSPAPERLPDLRIAAEAHTSVENLWLRNDIAHEL